MMFEPAMEIGKCRRCDQKLYARYKKDAGPNQATPVWHKHLKRKTTYYMFKCRPQDIEAACAKAVKAITKGKKV
jgi:hypothetical protein